MKRLLIGLIRLYQKYLSPLKRRACCRFTPTCSSYAIEALKKRGILVGLLLTVMRIFKCQPFGPSGYDPVPEKGLRNPRPWAQPMTKYYYPGEYGLENLPDNEEDDKTQ